jgi:antitoxin ParD1/3/4
MSISFTSAEKRFVQTKLEAGKYHSAKKVLEIVLRFLEECNCCETD